MDAWACTLLPPPLRAGEGWGGVLLLLYSRKFQSGFVPLPRPEPPFSVWPEKRGPKRGHPDGAPCAHPWAPGARAAYGVFRRHIHVPAKNWLASMRAILRTFLHPPAVP